MFFITSNEGYNGWKGDGYYSFDKALGHAKDLIELQVMPVYGMVNHQPVFTTI